MFLELKKQFEIAKRFRKKFSIIVIDIDDFYKINDEFGHPAGDRVLSFLADIIRSSLRDVDIKGRYGGDAFVISPLEVGSGNALAIAQKIQDNLNTALLPEGNIFGRFQISAGVSGIRADRTLDEIFIKAEKALLKSKKSGKNRVTMMR
jgi:diguanylate cyclase (GGDEF)-like protein